MANKKAAAPESKLKVGQRVRILVNTPENQPVTGTVRVIQDEPGKKVGVELDNYALFGHTLDEKLDIPEKSDPNAQTRYGKGWWTLEDNVEAL